MKAHRMDYSLCVAASATSLVATQIRGLIVLNNPSYEHQRWHGTLLMWVVITLTLRLNIFGIKMLPHIESVAGILFFFALLIPLVYLAPQSSASFVFTKLKIMADGHKTAFRGARTINCNFPACWYVISSRSHTSIDRRQVLMALSI